MPYDQSPEDSNKSPSLPSRGTPQLRGTPQRHGTPQRQHTPQRAAKVPIPRLNKSKEDSSAAGFSGPHQRVTHACEPCRQRKTKCSGERPICKHCEDFSIDCVYEDGKRDRTRKEYNSMAARVAECEALLQHVSHRVCEADQAVIQKILNKDDQEPYTGLDVSPTTASSRQTNMVDGMDNGVEKEDLAQEYRVTGPKSMDCVNEDLNRTAASRATGFMGKNSEVNWLGQIRARTQHADDQQDERDGVGMKFGSEVDGLADGKPGVYHPVSESTYHCDDMALDLPFHVQAYQIPPKAIADLLLTCYLESVHPAFPILGKTTFVKQYHAYYNNPALQTGPLWLAILNLCFAIAARYGRLARAEWISGADDEYAYFSRARLLGLGVDALWVHGELQRIQVTGLTSFYLMATNQINRAYAMSGIAVRHALSLGLNLRNQDRKLAESSKEIRCRVWWAVALTERTLSMMTGRPTAFSGSDCTAPLPIPLDEASFMSSDEPYKTPAVTKLRRTSTDESRSTERSLSTTSSAVSLRYKSPSGSSTVRSPVSVPEAAKVAPNMGLFFLYIAKLSNLNEDIAKQLYRPPVVDKPWASVQSIRSRFHERLERWRSALPPVFDFTKSQQEDEYCRVRMCLAFSYYSTVIITNRPFLCKMERKMPDETERGKSIDQANAHLCVIAAQAVLAMLPDQPNPVGMCKETPWWNMVHHLMQAVTIILLELSIGAVHCPNNVDELMRTAQKAVRWLQSMSPDDVAAARAWKLSSELLEKVAPRVGGKIDERIRWPGPLDPDTQMEPVTQDLSAFSAYYPASSSSGNYSGTYSGHEPVTTWEPLMFTSYDNYLFGDNDPALSLPDRQQQDWIDGAYRV
ncbi:MAG: hypothetical protein Q9221_005768 [Calogaya cf. arnoldii]